MSSHLLPEITFHWTKIIAAL